MTAMNDLRARIDASDMLGRILAFPEQAARAWEIGAAFVKQAQLPRGPFARVVVCGMGGSAIGGDLARSFLGERAEAPLMSCRDYALPGNLARGALVVASSYSGNTGETLSAYDAARAAGAAIVAVTSGGELAKRCARDGVPVCTIPGGMPPRSAIGFSLFPMLQILRACGAAAFTDAEFEESLAAVRDRCEAYAPGHKDNAAIELAHGLHGRTAFVYAAPSLLEGVARRWACQFNENGKVLAHFAFFPELNHNEIVGWEASPHLMSRAVIFSLEDRDDHPMTRRQAGVGLSIMGPLAARVERLESPGGGRLARMLSMMLLGDFASVYLAYLNGVDPTPVTKIDQLKKELA
ncbi:MAG: bifunctional phosphoglucose/phosphomannose isomerase [Candidatus Krumholzibacteria bacterium]|nr:bifunctional phosphoglucose/phosphomannose isomerase [Candidatus Krumholzibacteria bacterium]MDH4336504.1 bifunctional phosphoglucose/phosphomannose isomerase [Candidatus Krumholzibacteria bacterium]MDH5269585.1 bifunctional phosphoglucose/phosphomannose isomerase [Candidatus Krumholzibacteria bacterium]